MSSKVSGKVTEVLVEAGQQVAAGQVIARLDDSNVRAALEQAKAQAVAAEAAVAVAHAGAVRADEKLRRSQTLRAKGYVSEDADQEALANHKAAQSNEALAAAQLNAARAGVEVLRRALDDTVIRAPFSGVITAKSAQPGEIVAPVAGGGFTRTGVGTIIDMDSLQLQVDVSENFINRIRPGMAATVRLDAYPDWTIPAHLTAIIPTADRSKATVSVVVDFATKNPRILPDMGAHVAFLGNDPPAAATSAVLVPAAALAAGNGGRGIVFVLRDGRVERRVVRLGLKAAQNQVVTAGLRAGETVAVGDLSRLRDGGRVKLRNSNSDPT